MSAPALTGQEIPAEVPPAAPTASQRVGTWMSVCSMYQTPVGPPGSKGRLCSTPCRAGRAPVTMVVWDG